MAPDDSKRPPAASADRGKKTVALITRETKAGHAVLANIGVKKRGPMNRIARQTTLEDRLEAKAARGDRLEYSGPSLDEMSREQRHKLLYGE